MVISFSIFQEAEYTISEHHSGFTIPQTMEFSVLLHDTFPSGLSTFSDVSIKSGHNPTLHFAGMSIISLYIVQFLAILHKFGGCHLSSSMLEQKALCALF